MKIMFFTDSPAVASGMGRVAYNLGKHFNQISGVDYASIGWHHENFKNFNEWKVYSVPKSGPMEDHGAERNAVESILKEFKPDFLLTLGDVWDFQYMGAMSEAYPFKWLAYYNIDSGPIKIEYLSSLMFPWGVATTSHFGRRIIQDLDPSLDVDVIWHGYDSSQYHWMNIPPSARVVKIPSGTEVLADLRNKFVILMDSQNTHRKNYPQALEAFELFAADKPDVFLQMVTDPHGKINGFDLEYALHYLYHIDKSKYGLLPTSLPEGQWFQDSYLNYLYNMSDVYLSVSRAEGFGLSVLQAMATKTIPLVTDAASYPELVADGRGLTIDVAAYEYDFGYRRLALADSKDCAKKLDFLYRDWQEGGQLAREIHGKGLDFAAENTWEASFNNISNWMQKASRTPKLTLYPNHPYIKILPDVRAIASKAARCGKAKGDKVGMVVMGGLGDNIQAIPVIKGIERKHPDSNLFLVVEANSGIFFDWLANPLYHKNLRTIELRHASFASVHKSLVSAFDVFYDVRYVSGVYAKNRPYPLPPESEEFFKQGGVFYHKWPRANNVIHHLDKHVVDIRLLSCGLQDYASIDDMVLPTREITLPPGKFISVHNSAGGVGQLKILPEETFTQIIRYLTDKGYYVLQTGYANEPLLEGAIDLRGMTDCWETAHLLKHATLHIGPEGALYHMSKAVGGRSLVWLCVTPPEVFTYPDTIVMPSTKTSDFRCEPCWWKGDDYFHNKCMLGYKYCINLPTAEEVIERLRKEGI